MQVRLGFIVSIKVMLGLFMFKRCGSLIILKNVATLAHGKCNGVMFYLIRFDVVEPKEFADLLFWSSIILGKKIEAAQLFMARPRPAKQPHLFVLFAVFCLFGSIVHM